MYKNVVRIDPVFAYAILPAVRPEYFALAKCIEGYFYYAWVSKYEPYKKDLS